MSDVAKILIIFGLIIFFVGGGFMIYAFSKPSGGVDQGIMGNPPPPPPPPPDPWATSPLSQHTKDLRKTYGQILKNLTNEKYINTLASKMLDGFHTPPLDAPEFKDTITSEIQKLAQYLKQAGTDYTNVSDPDDVQALGWFEWFLPQYTKNSNTLDGQVSDMQGIRDLPLTDAIVGHTSGTIYFKDVAAAVGLAVKTIIAIL